MSTTGTRRSERTRSQQKGTCFQEPPKSPSGSTLATSSLLTAIPTSRSAQSTTSTSSASRRKRLEADAAQQLVQIARRKAEQQTKAAEHLAEQQAKAAEHLAEQQAKAAEHLAEREEAAVSARLAADLAELEEDEAGGSDQGSVIQQESHVVWDWLDRAPNPDLPAMEPTLQATAERVAVTEKPQTTMGDVAALAKALTDAMQTTRPLTTTDRLVSRLAIPDLPVFSGDGMEWLHFKRAYDTSTRVGQFSDDENMARLHRCLRGEARDAVSSQLLTATTTAGILRTLQMRFGRPDAILASIITEIRRMPRLTGQRTELVLLATKVENCVATIRATGYLGYLHSPELVADIIAKLTETYVVRWQDRSCTLDAAEPKLPALAGFLMAEAERSCAAGTVELPVVGRKEKPRRLQPSQHAILATEGSTQRKQRLGEPRTTSDKKPALPCLFCGCDEHRIEQCPDFRDTDVDQRWDWARKERVCFRCLAANHLRSRCRARKCSKCARMHHIMLHASNAPSGPKTDEEQITTNTWDSRTRRVLLKILPVELEGPRGRVSTFALLDEGSTVSLIDQAAADEIGADGPADALRLRGASGMCATEDTSRRVKLTVLSDGGRFEIDGVRTVRNLSLPRQGVSNADLRGHQHLKGQPLAVYDNATPAILIGQDHWDLVVAQEVRSAGSNAPAASRTKLGWVLHGSAGSVKSYGNDATIMHVRDSNADDELHALVKKYFTLDDLGVAPRNRKDAATTRALSILDSTTRRMGNRWETGLLWKTDEKDLPSSRNQALHRLHGIEKKMERDPQFAAAYTEQVENLVTKGYARRLTADEAAVESPRTWYLPHFCVSNVNKRKLRLVFDAAAKSQGTSLNDALLAGPDLLHSLLGVLFRFREKPVAIIGDIKEMFMQIKIRPCDQSAQRFLWRGGARDSTPHSYQMTSLIFGATSSPCTAIYVRNKNAEQFRDSHPRAFTSITTRHYMDDCLDSVDTEDEARQLVRDVSEIHRRGGFEIRGWASNRPAVLEDVHADKRIDGVIGLAMDDEKIERTLGLMWNPKDDTLGFDLSMRKVNPDVSSGRRTPTKREMLSIVMSVFDPLGLLAPFTIRAKILMQDVWRSGIGWDDRLGTKFVTRWNAWLHALKTFQNLAGPRCYNLRTNEAELHVFCDASEKAYAAVAYWRSTTGVAFIASKSRVTPLKPVSIPRLELQAALLASRLAKQIQDEHDIRATKRYFWTDSRTVWSWIHTEPRTFKAYVAHRLAEIAELTEVQEWRWLPGKRNPADDATRDTGDASLQEDSRWLGGPEFLQSTEEMWPTISLKAPPELPPSAECERRPEIADVLVSKHVDGDWSVPQLARFSSWNRLVRSTAYVLYFVERARRRLHDGLTVALLQRAETLLIKRSQNEAFSSEIASLERGVSISPQSRLRNVTPTLDTNGLLRVAGRIDAVKDVEEEVKHPLILDGKNSYTRLLVAHHHAKLGHGSNETVINELRQRFWILNVRPTVKTVASSCVTCRRWKAQPAPPRMGDLPTARLEHHHRPFTYCGLDYFGPMEVAVGRRREKRYGALFTCLTTRAVHLEVAHFLSTDSVIMALRRMAARRGWPRQIFSDNGTNFRGADSELGKALRELDTTVIHDEMTSRGVEWHFNPPSAPHMGGSWERLVRSVKNALRTVLNSRAPKEEVLSTLFTEAEYTVNSRPLTHVSVDPRDEEALTPNHFLLGTSHGLPSSGSFTDDDLVLRKQWRIAQRLADHFWRRWLREYLPTLQRRSRWTKDTTSLKPDDLVLIADNTAPRNMWPRGRIIAVHPGKDGRVRVVDVASRGTVLRRPAHKIIVLAVSDVGVSNGPFAPGGRMLPTR